MAIMTFNAVILKEAYDGDTFSLRIDLGFTASIDKGFRLGNNLDCAEVRQNRDDDNDHEKKVGIYTRDLVRQYFREGDKVTVSSHHQKTGKYGRIIGDIRQYGISLMTLLKAEELVVPESLSDEGKQVLWEEMFHRLVAEGKIDE